MMTLKKAFGAEVSINISISSRNREKQVQNEELTSQYIIQSWIQLVSYAASVGICSFDGEPLYSMTHS
jgi:hypothetical protein